MARAYLEAVLYVLGLWRRDVRHGANGALLGTLGGGAVLGPGHGTLGGGDIMGPGNGTLGCGDIAGAIVGGDIASIL